MCGHRICAGRCVRVVTADVGGLVTVILVSSSDAPTVPAMNTSTDTPTRPRERTAAGSSSQRPAATQARTEQLKADAAEARLQIGRAFELAGLVSDGVLVCPKCGSTKKGVVKLFADGGWRCVKGTCGGSGPNKAIDVLAEYGGYTMPRDMPKVVDALLGRSNVPAPKPVAPPVAAGSIKAASDFKAATDATALAVYRFIHEAGDVAAAQAYYGRFHIADKIVAETGCVVVAQPERVIAEAVRRFGRDTLIAAGVLIPGEDGRRDHAVINRDYNVIEPHRRADGTVVGMQFRASLAHEPKIRAYAGLKAEYDAQKSRWEAQYGPGTFDPDGKKKPRFYPKFMSLRGGIIGQHLIGCGLPAVAALQPGALVYIVEGLKDMMAARTMGLNAFGIPGTNVMPGDDVMAVLADKRLILWMDGDDGGDAGIAKLSAHLTAHGVQFKVNKLPAGADVTNMLEQRRKR
jgi:hypothetical protein